MLHDSVSNSSHVTIINSPTQGHKSYYTIKWSIFINILWRIMSWNPISDIACITKPCLILDSPPQPVSKNSIHAEVICMKWISLKIWHNGQFNSFIWTFRYTHSTCLKGMLKVKVTWIWQYSWNRPLRIAKTQFPNLIIEIIRL